MGRGQIACPGNDTSLCLFDNMICENSLCVCEGEYTGLHCEQPIVLWDFAHIIELIISVGLLIHSFRLVRNLALGRTSMRIARCAFATTVLSVMYELASLVGDHKLSYTIPWLVPMWFDSLLYFSMQGLVTFIFFYWLGVFHTSDFSSVNNRLKCMRPFVIVFLLIVAVPALITRILWTMIVLKFQKGEDTEGLQQLEFFIDIGVEVFFSLCAVIVSITLYTQVRWAKRVLSKSDSPYVGKPNITIGPIFGGEPQEWNQGGTMPDGAAVGFLAGRIKNWANDDLDASYMNGDYTVFDGAREDQILYAALRVIDSTTEFVCYFSCVSMACLVLVIVELITSLHAGPGGKYSSRTPTLVALDFCRNTAVRLLRLFVVFLILSLLESSKFEYQASPGRSSRKTSSRRGSFSVTDDVSVTVSASVPYHNRSADFIVHHGSMRGGSGELTSNHIQAAAPGILPRAKSISPPPHSILRNSLTRASAEMDARKNGRR